MAHKKTKVFVSYSRHDESLVKPLAGLLGVASDDAVFLDVSSLKPGDLWEEKIIGAVKEASVFVLCWCCQSQASPFVAKEIGTALSAGKKHLVPVLFCSTKLPDNLADRQWIDLRGRIVHVCNHPDAATQPHAAAPAASAPAPTMQPPAPSAAPKHVPRDVSGRKLYRLGSDSKPQPAAAPGSKGLYLLIGMLAGLGLLLIAVVGWLRTSSIPHGISAHPGPPAGMTIIPLITGVLLGLILIFLLVFRWLRPKTRAGVGPSKQQPEDIIASRARSYFEGLGQ